MKKALKNGYRAIINQKPYSLINIFGLTVGLSCVLLILLWVKAETGFDKFHEDHESIFRVSAIYKSPNRDMNMGMINAPAGPEFKARFPVIEESVRTRSSNTNLKYKEKFYPVNLLYTDTAFFEFFSFDLLTGKESSCLDAPDKIVLSRSAAAKIFGNESPLTKMVRIGENDFTVVAIAEDPPVNSSIQFEAVCQLSNLEKRAYVGWDGGLQCQTFVRLIDGVDMDQLGRDIDKLMFEVVNRRSMEHGFQTLPYLEPLAKIHLGSDTEFDSNAKGSWKRVLSFSFVAFLILLTACFNFVNISTALSVKRSKEVSVRKIFGSARRTIMIGFVVESGLAIFFSLLLALLLVKATLSYFNILVGVELTFSVLSSVEWIIVSLILFLSCTFLASFYSAWYLSAIATLTALRESAMGRRKQMSRNILVTFQFTLSISLIICCLVIFTQMRYVKGINLGFSRDNVVVINLNDVTAQRSEMIKERFLSLPGIVSVTRSAGGVPGLEFTSNGYKVEGVENPILTNAVYVDKEYITTLGMMIKMGRNFRDNLGDKYTAIINETFVIAAGWDNPLGRTIERNGIEYNVIGVIKDFHTSSLHNKIEPLLMTQVNEFGAFRQMIMKTEGVGLDDLKWDIEKIFTEEDPGSQLNYRLLSDSFDNQYLAEKNLNLIFLIMALIAIIISGLGLFGLATFATKSRSREISIRKVNGAMVHNILSRFYSELLIWIILAFLIAAPISSIIMNSWLTNFEYKTRISLWILLAGGLLTLLIGILSIGLATFREANRNPVESLRFE